jgi:hypothetical protein
MLRFILLGSNLDCMSWQVGMPRNNADSSNIPVFDVVPSRGIRKGPTSLYAGRTSVRRITTPKPGKNPRRSTQLQ